MKISEMNLLVLLTILLIALIQLEKGVAEQPDLNNDEIIPLYDTYYNNSKRINESKNHDYGEAWREMRVSFIN